MKKFLKTGLLLALAVAATTSFAQKKIKSGVVKFEMVADTAASPEMAMMAGMTMDFYFTPKMQKMDMTMLGGLMRMQTIVPSDSPKDGSMLVDMMGRKMHIVEIPEDQIGKSNAFFDTEGAGEITYDKKDVKEIAGYECHAATLKSKDGAEMKFYVTESITAPKVKGSGIPQGIEGYPLEMNISPGEGFNITFRAVEVKDVVAETDFQVPEGYQKMTMAEFQKQMEGMGMGIGK